VMCEDLPAASRHLVQEDESGEDSDSGSDGGSSMDADGSAAKPGKPQRAAKKVRAFCKRSVCTTATKGCWLQVAAACCNMHYHAQAPMVAQLMCLLTAQQAAAAMAVGVGSFSDPEDLQVCLDAQRKQALSRRCSGLPARR
jgi:hypothetical protein